MTVLTSDGWVGKLSLLISSSRHIWVWLFLLRDGWSVSRSVDDEDEDDSEYLFDFLGGHHPSVQWHKQRKTLAPKGEEQQGPA
eukprot:7891135-Prorocentrum_lima.AAC.1